MASESQKKQKGCTFRLQSETEQFADSFVLGELRHCGSDSVVSLWLLLAEI